MGAIYNSPDVSNLEVAILFDISNTNPVINLTNQSTGDHLDQLTWVLNIYSPTGTPIYNSDFDTPWVTGEWTTEAINNAWPRPFGQIEWSGADYSVEFQVKDSTGAIYYLNKNTSICKPIGNTKKSTNTYGQVNLQVQVLCSDASLYVSDLTSKTYQGNTGTNLSDYLAVDYPRDPSGNLPSPYVVTAFVDNAIVPITYNAKGYVATYYTIYQYDLGDNCFVKIRYTAQVKFNVQCNAQLCIIACQIDGLTGYIESGACDGIEAARQKLQLITAKAIKAQIAVEYPTCGIDIDQVLEEIQLIGGYQCDCGDATTGIGSQSTLIDGIVFGTNVLGGDVQASFSQEGNNVVLSISDKTYTFSICADSDTEAFEFNTTTNNYTKNVCLSINKTTLADELLTTIKNDVDLTNLFNSIVNISGGGFLVSVDGKCVLESPPVSDYTWALENIPPATTYATINQITDGGVIKVLNFSFNQTNLPALQTYLNGIGVGTFVVTTGASGEVIITSADNPNNLTNLRYNPGSGLTSATQTTQTTGVQQYTANEVLQALINYLCGITDAEIFTSVDFVVCYIDAEGNTVQQTVSAGSALTDLINNILATDCQTIQYIQNLKATVDCDTLKAVFPSSTAAIVGTDYVLGTKSGACAQVGGLEWFQWILNNMDATTKNIFCAAVTACGAGLSCAPYDIFNVVVSEHSTTCASIVGIEGVWS